MKQALEIRRKNAYCPRYPNQAQVHPLLHKLVDTALMFACCAGTISIFSFIMATC